MEPESAPSNSSGIHLQHISSEQQGDIEMHQQQEEQQQQRQLTQGWQQHQHQPENHSNQQEQFEESPMKQREESQPQLHEQSSPQPQQEQQQSQLEQQQQRQQLQQVQMQQPPQQQPQQHLQQGQMQPPPQQQQPQQSQQHLQQLQQHLQELPQSQQEQLQPQQQLSSQPQQQHLQQVPQSQSQQQLQQVQSQLQQQHLQQFMQSQQQLQQSQLQSQQQHLKQLPEAQQEQQPPLPQQQLQQSPMSSQQHLQQLPQSQHQPQQQLQQSPLPSQPQHVQQLPQSQQQPQQQLQQSSLPSPQQHLQQHQQQHLQQLPQRQQQLQAQVQQQQQQLSHQQAPQPATGQASSSTRGQNASISFGSLIPIILPHISRDQSMQLQQLYSKLRKNEVTKEDFLRLTRKVVGDTMLVNAVKQMQQRQAQSQSVSSTNPNQQPQQPQQPQQQQKHTQGVSQQFSQPYQQVPPVTLQQQSHRTSDHQPHSHTSAPTSMPMSHSSSENNPQHSRQAGEQRSEFSSTHLNQTSALSLHQVKQEVDRTVVGFPPSSQQQQQHLQLPQSPFSMYGRNPANYSSQSFSVSPGISQPSGVKVPVQDPQTRQVMHAQGGVQAQGGPPQLSNIKTMPKYDTSKLSKRREDEERQKMLQSGGTSHFSVQHQPSIWPTALDKEQAGNSGISSASSVHIKQETNDNGDRPHAFQTLQPFADNHGQPAVLQKPEDQSVKTSTITSGSMPTANQPLGSTVVHSDHVIQAPLATSSGAALHHPLSAFGGPISGGHSSGAALQGQLRGLVPSTPPSSALGSQIKTPPKKPMIGQKKPYEAAVPPSQVASKKQKVSGGFLDQSIDQLNDVTAVSGVNLKEEEEQLFAGPKEESRATEAMRRVVQEEEERTFLKKGPLHAKLAGIMAKYGLKYFSTDSERCLSLCVEERLRTMLGQLIRLSKQRVDLEKASHKVDITSDVRRQILEMNKKAKEDLEKKQAEEAEKLRKLNEPENNPGAEGEKDEARTKAQKAHKEEDDKMRANAANVAARAAVGGDDMLSKWQLMAEQARQKREGTSDGASVSRNRDVNRKSMVVGSNSVNISDHQDSPSTGMGRNLGRTLVPSSQPKPVRTICVKDVIALLERDPHMTKSTLLYRLYERDAESNKENASENQNNENT